MMFEFLKRKKEIPMAVCDDPIVYEGVQEDNEDKEESEGEE